MTQDQIVQQALMILDARMRAAPVLSSPEAVRDYLRLSLHDRAHEVESCTSKRTDVYVFDGEPYKAKSATTPQSVGQAGDSFASPLTE